MTEAGNEEKKSAAKPQHAHHEPPRQNDIMPAAVRFSIFCILVTSLVFLPATIVFIVCMLPTFVAAVVERQPQKTAWLTVGAMNLAGMVPAWFKLWESGHSIEAALALVATPSVWLVAYAAAGIGWVIYHNVTPAVAGVMVKRNEKRLADIDARQKELIKKWGETVTKAG